MRTVTGQPGSPPAMLADPSLPHQLVMTLTSRAGRSGCIAVSCNCLARGAGRGRPRGIIDWGATLPAARAAAAWRRWHEERGTRYRDMSGRKHPIECTCGKCDRERDLAAALNRAEAAVAAETAKRHVLDLGDRAVEVVSGKPGVWHLVTDGRCGPVLSPDDISGMLEADREIKARRDQRDREVAGTRYAMTARQADEITSALDQGDRELAAMALDLSQPLGLSAAELERLVPDRAPGTCVSCRLPLSPRDGAVRCAWCLALHDLTPRPPARPPAHPKLAGPRPVPLSPEEALAAWSCTCGCPAQRAHQRHTGVRPELPRPTATATLRPLIAGCLSYWASWHWAGPAGVIAGLLTFALFVTFVSRVVRRAAR